MKRLVFPIIILLLFVSCQNDVYYNVDTAVNPKDAGSISISPTGPSILKGTSVIVTAQPNGEYVFTGWSGSLSGTENPKTVTVTSDLTVTGNFALRQYPLTINVEGEGTVSERVVSSKADYTSGTVVELTATPGTGWSFDHWEGDLVGEDNPARITITSAKTVKAVFTKNKYSYNLKIIGPGVVDEYLVQDTKVSLEYGTKVLLKAIPSEGAIFKGWSGSLSGINDEIVVDIDSAKEITATFDMDSFSLPDLMQPSVSLKRLYPGVYFDCAGWGHVFGTLDYNRDGFPDVVNCNISPDGISREAIEFFFGNAEGSFERDTKNTIADGPIWARKVIYGDYNKDGLPDICIIGHGWDNEPWPGEYPIILLSQTDGRYQDTRYTDFVSFYHGGASADFDNDGDLDIVLVDGGRGNEITLLNDGTGHFTGREDLLNHSLLNGMYTAEFYDIDNDGYIDFIAGLDDYLKTGDEDLDDYNNTPIVFWGNGTTFNHDNYSRLPKTNVNGFGIVTDFDFADVDGDGQDEVLLARTGDGIFAGQPVYTGWCIQVVKREGRSFTDISEQLMNYTDSYNSNDGWIILINMEEYKGCTYLAARKAVDAELLYELKDGKLELESAEKSRSVYNHGVSLMATPISFKNWEQWDGHSFSFNKQLENGADLSYLKDQGYSLEFFIKNEDPSLRIDIKFESFIDRESWILATYFYYYDASQHPTDGAWERVVVPLESLDDWTDKTKNYWEIMDHVHFQISSTGGQPFSLKDIRIRKVLPD